jgi:hypothetical protein
MTSFHVTIYDIDALAPQTSVLGTAVIHAAHYTTLLAIRTSYSLQIAIVEGRHS